jgi:transcription antitermination factor NusG
MADKTFKHKTWFVVYTKSRSEKKVSEELVRKGIECFLPVQKKLRKWKDRKKWVEMPLISGYCFVHITRKEYDSVLQTDNVVSYVTFEGKAASVPENQIDNLKCMLGQSEVEVSVTHDNFAPGQKVEVITGPLIGLQGELIGARGNKKFILRFEQINSIFTVEIKNSDITYIPDSTFKAR